MIKIKVDGVLKGVNTLFTEFAPLVKKTDKDGYIHIPIAKFLYFCHDIGILLAKIIEENAEIDETKLNE